MRFAPDPARTELHGATVEVHLHGEPGTWIVTVLISRPPGPPVDARSVDVEIVDTSGQVVRPVDRPEGPLVEAGGSLVVTANAAFRFMASAPPAEVIVRWDDSPVRFRIVGL